MDSVKKNGVKGRSFKGSLTVRNELGAVAVEERVQEVDKTDLHVVEGKAAEPKADQVEPKAAAEKRVAKDKISVAIYPADLVLLRKAAKKAGKSVSLFASECIQKGIR